MINNSAYYGLYNPAFSDDIGRTMLNQQLGTPGMDLDDYRLGTGVYGYGNPYANGMTQDTVEISGKKPEKKQPLWKKILIGAGIILGGGLLIRYGAKHMKGIRTKLSGFFNKLKGIFKKKTKTQPATPKQHNGLKARLASFWSNVKSSFKRKPKTQPPTKPKTPKQRKGLKARFSSFFGKIKKFFTEKLDNYFERVFNRVDPPTPPSV